MSSNKIIYNIKNDVTENININIKNNIIYPNEKVEELNEQILSVGSPSFNSPRTIHGMSIFNRFT
jgi:hypothetical protein